MRSAEFGTKILLALATVAACSGSDDGEDDVPGHGAVGARSSQPASGQGGIAGREALSGGDSGASDTPGAAGERSSGDAGAEGALLPAGSGGLASVSAGSGGRAAEGSATAGFNGGGATSGGSGGTSGAGGSSVLPSGFTEGAPLAQGLMATADPLLAVSRNGDAFVAWEGYDDARTSIWAIRYDAETQQFGEPTVLETNDQYHAKLWDLSVDEDGNAFVTFTLGFVFVVRYDAAVKAWVKPVQIEDHDDGGTDWPRVAAGPSGAGLLVWGQNDGSRTYTRTSRYDPAADTWSFWQAIDDRNLPNASFPVAAVDRDGNAIAAFAQRDALEAHLVTNHYDAGTETWSDPTPIEPQPEELAPASMVIRATREGDFFIAWLQVPFDALGDFQVWVARYDAASGFQAPVQLEEHESFATTGPSLSVDDAGNAFVVWTQEDHVWSSRYGAAGKSWSAAARIDDTAGWIAKWSSVASDPAGNAVMVSAQWPMPNINLPLDVVVNRYDVASETWGPGSVVETDNATVSGPVVGMDGNGRAFVVWRRSPQGDLRVSISDPGR